MFPENEQLRRAQVLQAISDLRPPAGCKARTDEANVQYPTLASAEIALPKGKPLKLETSPTGGQPQRLVVTGWDRLNNDSSTSRDRFIKKLTEELCIDLAAPGSFAKPGHT